MTANELMIGDWVQIVSDAPIMANEYHRIDWIRTGEVGLDNRKIVTYPYIQPILLTTEILEKNGWLSSDEPMVEFFGVGKQERKYKRIEFVHDLQHALRLCGIKKEIVL